MPGIGDQLALESVITFVRNERSGWSGIRTERQAVKLEEYTPSLLSRAPSSPGRQASACFRIFRLYSAVNRRRLGLSETSGSGADPEVPASAGSSAETPVALRAPSVPAAPRIPSKDSNCGIFIDLNLPALLTNLQGGQW